MNCGFTLNSASETFIGRDSPDHLGQFTGNVPRLVLLMCSRHWLDAFSVCRSQNSAGNGIPPPIIPRCFSTEFLQISRVKARPVRSDWIYLCRFPTACCVRNWQSSFAAPLGGDASNPETPIHCAGSVHRVLKFGQITWYCGFVAVFRRPFTSLCFFPRPPLCSFFLHSFSLPLLSSSPIPSPLLTFFLLCPLLSFLSLALPSIPPFLPSLPSPALQKKLNFGICGNPAGFVATVSHCLWFLVHSCSHSY